MDDKTNWELCAICQDPDKQGLRCPADSKRSDKGAGYKFLADSIKQFAELGCIPKNICVSRLDDGDGFEATFSKNKARWHKSCYDLFSSTRLKRAQKRKIETESNDETLVGGKFTRSNTMAYTKETASTSCFICDSDKQPLHRVSTFGVDTRVRECAAILNDEALLAKLGGGDLIALEACYHSQCLTALYRSAEYAKRSDVPEDQLPHRLEGIALAELVTFVEESRANGGDLPTFKLADLARMYTNCLQQLGMECTTKVNTSRLKERLLFQIPDLLSYNKGRDVFLAFHDDVGFAINRVHREDSDDEAMHLAKAATIVRKDILANKYVFNGSFDENCQQSSIPPSLLSFINMILYGPSIKAQTENNVKQQAALTIAQLVQFNTYHRRREGEVKRERRNRLRESPLPIYVGTAVHAKTRCRDLVQILHKLGISISYDRVLSISTDVGNEVCRRFEEDGAVCPYNLRKGLFTTAAMDNIDHNPSSTTAKDSFHGTGISLFQKPTADTPGTVREPINISPSSERNADLSIKELPKAYTEVAPVQASTEKAHIPAAVSKITTDARFFDRGLKDESSWLETVSTVVVNQESVDDSQVSWAGFHSHQPYCLSPSSTAVSALLPLFPDQSKSVAMIRHAMNVIKLSVDHLNPGQVPVIALDQPLYAVAKEIQWTWPDSYGEDKFVLVFGGLHIEMVFMKAMGDWLEGSGWTAVLAEANVASPGTAEAFLKVTSVTRTRRAHQVTACSLFILLQKAYQRYLDSVDNGALSFDVWCTKQSSLIPQFQYWHTALQLQLLLLVFLRSLRLADFEMYVDSVYKMLPWFFALNHTNYARWLPVHVRDMRELHKKAPQVEEAFKEGLFTVVKTRRRFSAIAIDQAHEQNNAMVKGDGGAVGLTENSNALRRWMLSGPEMARLVNEFETDMETERRPAESCYHHEADKSYQAAFHKDVRSLVQVLDELGNPFEEESTDLIVLDTKVVADESGVSRMQQIENLGKTQCDAYILERLEERKKPLHEAISRNQLSFFTTPQKKKSKAQQQLSSVKSDCSLFSRLFITCQTRNGDLDDFFRHENQACPPSISDLGNLRLPRKKSELTNCLEALTTPRDSAPDNCDAMIVDGPALVNMLKPKGTEKTFSEYAATTFVPYVLVQLRNLKRIDLVWDEYMENSLKATTRSKRGAGVRQRVAPDNKLPRNWKDFLREDQNKKELFKFLAECVTSVDSGQKQVISSHGSEVLSSLPREDVSSLAPCSHEEADTRMLLHAADALQCGLRRIVVRTVDTDVLVVAVGLINQLKDRAGADDIELWVAFGTGAHLRYIAAHEIADAFENNAELGLPAFHAFTGCDTVSCFYGKSKKTALDTWKSFPEVTPVFIALSSYPQDIPEDWMSTLERFVILLYDRTSMSSSVNEARKHLFTRKGRRFDALPPTRDALLQHVKRTAYQAGHIWGQALVPNPSLPSPQDWGWFLDGEWRPYWTTLPEITKSCQQLVQCGCKKGCRGGCSCRKANFHCTALCKCSGECDNG